VLSRERWEAVSSHLDDTMDMAAPEREAYLAALRQREPQVAADLEELLAVRSAVDAEGFLEAAVALPPAATLAGQKFGAYTVVSQLGEGGMGTVWLARRSDGRFEGEAALKLLNASFIGRTGEERFQREGSILARLAHPNIARLVDAGVSPAGQPYLVLEHVEGERIDVYCDARSLNIPARLVLFLEVLAAVAHAHANLIVHRDLKPSNVLVGNEGRVKLLDFGIAKLIEGEGGAEATALTHEGGRAMTPEYAAPEQVTGGPITTATDVYALGILLYVLLAGRHPAGPERRSTADLVRAIVEIEPRRPSDAVADEKAQTKRERERNASLRGTSPEGLRRALRGDLDTIVSRALKKNPQERYASVIELADDVRRFLTRKPISARPDTLAYRAAKFAQRHTRILIAAAAIVALLGGLVGFYTARLAAERDRARVQAQKAEKVSELLTGLLTGADPYAAREKQEPTVRGILDAGAARIERELAGDPELQAEMLTVMGRVYERLGDPARAQPLLERAVALGRRSRGGPNLRVAQSLNDLGVLLREKGNYAAAAPMLEEAAAMRTKLLGREHAEVAVTLVELGRVFEDQGQDAGAEPLYREALAIRKKVLGDGDHETATSLNELALLLRRQGELAEAEALFRQVLEIDRKTRGEEHPDTATAYNNLALIAMDRGDFTEAERLSRLGLSLSRKTLGDNHPRVAGSWNTLSSILREQGRYDEAFAATREAMRLTAPLGEEHPLTVTYGLNLGRLYLVRGEWRQAEPILRRAVEVRRRILPAGDWRVAQAESLLGESLNLAGRYDEAEKLLTGAGSVLKEGAGPQGREAEANRARLASLARARASGGR
jgi:serine/threonine protein kinase/Tfp pilus assembly protein PilF